MGKFPTLKVPWKFFLLGLTQNFREVVMRKFFIKVLEILRIRESEKRVVLRRLKEYND